MDGCFGVRPLCVVIHLWHTRTLLAGSSPYRAPIHTLCLAFSGHLARLIFKDKSANHDCRLNSRIRNRGKSASPSTNLCLTRSRNGVRGLVARPRQPNTPPQEGNSQHTGMTAIDCASVLIVSTYWRRLQCLGAAVLQPDAVVKIGNHDMPWAADWQPKAAIPNVKQRASMHCTMPDSYTLILCNSVSESVRTDGIPCQCVIHCSRHCRNNNNDTQKELHKTVLQSVAESDCSFKNENLAS